MKMQDDDLQDAEDALAQAHTDMQAALAKLDDARTRARARGDYRVCEADDQVEAQCAMTDAGAVWRSAAREVRRLQAALPKLKDVAGIDLTEGMDSFEHVQRLRGEIEDDDNGNPV
jgi:hypothetical protein